MGDGITSSGYKFIIYNRWGEIIFESQNPNVGWDGTYGPTHEPVQDGVYIWILHYKDVNGIDQKLVGHVTLLK